MPVLRSRLSRAEAREYGRCLRELRAEGIDVNCPDDSLEDIPLDITVFGGLASQLAEWSGRLRHLVALGREKIRLDLARTVRNHRQI